RLTAITLLARADMKRVREQIIHGRQAGRAYVAEPSHLHRRRPASKHGQPRAAMAIEVEQNVDFVPADLLSQLISRKLQRRSPLVGCRAEPGGVVIFSRTIGVANDGALRLVEMLDRR